MKRFKLLLVALFAIGFTTLALGNLVNTGHKLKVKEIQLHTTETELKTLELQQKELNTKLDEEIEQKTVNEEKVKQLEAEKQQLEQQRKELEAQLQARIEAKKLAARGVLGSPTAFAAEKPAGSKLEWLQASGIPESEWWAVDYIVTHESGWNPCAYYPSKSDCNLTAQQINNARGGDGTACGLGMSLPCGKWGMNWTDPVNQLRHMNIYVAKYGGWAGAVEYWKVNRHY